MTVRWKPLLVLSGLFVVVAVVGLIAMAFTLVPKGSRDILPAARAERAAKQYDKAWVRYKQALQVDGKNAAIHEEFAAMLDEWLAHAPAEKQAEIRATRLYALSEATKYDRTAKEPRRALLDSAMTLDEVPESLHWAKQLLALEPGNANAHFVLASEALESHSPVVPDVKRHLTALEEAKAPEVRVASIQARLAQVTGDAPAREEILAKARSLSLPPDASPVDRTAMLRLRALDVETTTDLAKLPERVKALQNESRAIVAGTSVVPKRVMRLSYVLEHVQSSLTLAVSKRDDPKEKQAITALVDGIEEDVEAIFRNSLTAARKTDLHVYYKYAEHLKIRGKRERCLEVVDEALKTPLAGLATSNDVVMALREVAVVVALSDPNDKNRYEKATPHVKALLASTSLLYQGYGHLFQGAIELEQAGVTGGQGGENTAPVRVAAGASKLRSSALNHLKNAAAQLPDVVEAQARYGVALVLAQEPSLGRQYLQSAMRLGASEPQFQIWAAWSMVQAGYAEEAEPIVRHMLDDVAQGRISRDFEGTLHLLSGEIHQGKRSPEDLKLAQAEFERSYPGESAPPTVQIRMAQIDVQLGHPEKALKRVEGLRAAGHGGTGAEYLAVVTLMELGKKAEATDTLAKARQTYPDSEDLVGLEATMLSREKKVKEADAVLAAFLARNPENLSVVLMRSQVLADLGDVKEARRLLVNVADRSDNSAPLVQLALLDMKQKDYDAVPATIAKVRARWKEAAAADLLDAQLALEQGNTTEAIGHFDAALKKDPGNKAVQFWRAQIESQNGSSTEAARAFEAIASQNSSKEMESGLSITAAAQSALANLALQSGDVDAAIKRFEALRAGGTLGGLTRADRWQLVAAYTVKNQWGAAKREVKTLLDDPKDPPSHDERVRAANFYRQTKEEAAAIAQLDYVLAVNPSNASAVVMRAYLLADSKRGAEAAALLRKAITATPKDKEEKAPAIFFLMLSAVESTLPPESDGGKRALAVLDQGLGLRPKSLELVQAKYRLLLAGQGPNAAVAFVESSAKDDSDGVLHRLLADVYRDQGDLDNAEKTLDGLLAKNPMDPKLASAFVQVMALQATRAGDRNDRARERSYMDKTDALIRDYRARFPKEVAFLQADSEQSFRKGDVPRATAITKEIDQLAKYSPVGPLLRARIYASQGRIEDSAVAYADALERNPRQPNVRLLLGQTSLRLGKSDEALRQAQLVLDLEPDRAEAVLLAARALAQPDTDTSRTAARQGQAIELLNLALKRQPKFSAAYHLIAEIRLMQNQPDAALATLRAGIEAAPEDALGIAQIVELLSRPSRDGTPPSPEKLAAADATGTAVGKADTKGGPTLAVAVGFHKAGQLERARDWAEKAAAKLDTPLVHMNYGDILLSLAERAGDAGAVKSYCERAVEQYDLVLKTQANSVEAVNNKAWILHSYSTTTRRRSSWRTAFSAGSIPRSSLGSSSTHSAPSKRRWATPAARRSLTRRASARRPTTPC